MRWHTIKQTLSTTVVLFLIGLSLTAVYALSQGTKFLSVQSGSMVPAYSKGDLVIVNNAPDQSYKVGDVITFINPNNKQQTVTHRIAKTLPSDGMLPVRFVTKGDANAAADMPVYGKDIVGKVSFALPYLGFGFDFVRQPLGLILLIYIPALTIIVSEARKLAKYYKEQEPYVAAGHDPNRPLPHTPTAAKRTARAGAVAIIAVTAVAAPVAHAALLSSATLSNTSLSTLAVANYPLLSKVQFTNGVANGNTSADVSVDNNNPQNAITGNARGNNATSGNASNNSNTSITVNVDGSTNNGNNQRIEISNPTNAPLNISNWTLSDNTTTRNIPNNTVVAARATYTFAWPVAGSLSRSGDRVLLRNAANALVDSLSWGSDNSQLTPAISTTSNTQVLKRDDLRYDSGKASDWSVQ